MSAKPVDGSRIKESARDLAFPRYPGTEGNRKAAELVEQWFQDAGLEVAREAFSYDIRPAMRAVRAICVIAGLLLGTSGALAMLSSSGALLLLMAGFVVGGTLLVWAPGAERIYAAEGSTETWNIVGRRRVEAPRLILVLMAHYDSKSQNLGFAGRNGPVVLALLSACSLAGLLAADLLAGRPLGPLGLPLALAIPGAASLMILSTLRSGNASPGGVDNAGSVAILRELAQLLPARASADVDLIFLSTGAEEDHMVGAMRWLDRHAEEWADTKILALNFDGCGAPGRLMSMNRFGLFRTFAPEIEPLAVQAARRLGIPLHSIWLPPAMGVDAIPFHHRGVPCLTITSGSLCRATLAFHTARDTAENLDPAALEACALLALETVINLPRRHRNDPLSQ